MQILYEPVAVRHVDRLTNQMPQFGKAIGVISEKAGHENAKSKYPDNNDPLWKELRVPADRGNKI